MSWLSTFVHNNATAIGTVGNLIAPGAGSGIVGLFGGQTVASDASTGVNPKLTQAFGLATMGFQGGGRRAPGVSVGASQRDSVGVKVGRHTIYAKEYAGAAVGYASSSQPGTAVTCQPRYHLARTPRLAAQGVCTKIRRMNFANGHAAMRAARRLKGTHRLLVKIERALHRGVPQHHSTRGRSCGCKRG